MLPTVPRPPQARVRLARLLRAAAPLALASACASADRVASPAGGPTRAAGAAAGKIVVSQIYGGGGNSGSTYKNDFVELYNAGGTAVSVAGWSVQYASSTGTSWQVTTLAGTIQPGQYYLVQEAAGAGGTAALPAPDATGAIAMGATAAKVALVSNGTALAGACPIPSAAVVDFVGYGSGPNCFEGSGTTPAPSNVNAVLRKSAGQQDTDDNAADFAAGAPTPRNGSVVTNPGGPVAAVTIAPSPAAVTVGATLQLSARAVDASGNTANTTFTWATSDTAVATVDGAGLVRGRAVSSTPVTVTATSANGIAGTSQLTVVAQGAIASVTWSGSPTPTSSMSAGFQTQLFTPVAKDGSGNVVAANFAFEALDPTVATVLPVGNSAIITGVAASGSTSPRFRVTATPAGGGSAFSVTTAPVAIEAAAYADSAGTFADNAEFGRPTAASAANVNDLLIARSTYTLSYNASRGTPNWVSYELDQRQRSTGQDRCNCFTAEPALPAANRVYTSDYTNGGYDRGHMARSADRTVTNGENARTFYLSNIVPQTADLNQGVWAAFENQLADSAAAGRAVYVITGPLYSATAAPRYIKQDSGQTKIRIPDSTWKVAFVGPYSTGHAFQRGDVRSWDDLAGTAVLAVNMPNVAGVRNDPPSKYYTTVRAIEASTGYNFLSLLPTAYQNAVETGDHAPAPAFNGPTAGSVGQPLAFNAAGTTDPDAGDVLAYAWNFGDGTSAAGASATKSYAAPGAYTVVLTVTDRSGGAVTRRGTVNVGNAAPTVTLPGALPTAAAGQAYSLPIAYSDPSASPAPFRLSVDWGDGTTTTGTYVTAYTASRPLVRQKVYAAAGTYAVTVRVTDKYGATSAPATVQITVP